MSWFGLLFRRAASQRTVLAAAFAVILVSTILAATLGRFAARIGDVAVRSALASAPAADTDLVFDGGIGAGDLAAGERAARGYQVPGFAGDVLTSGQSSSFALPAGTGSTAGVGQDPALTSFWTVDGVAGHATLTAGVWPAGPATTGSTSPDPAADRPVPVALPDSVADALRLQVGSRLRLVGRLDPHPVVTVAVVGLFRARDGGDPFWQLDPLGGAGVRRLGYTTYGPLLTDRSEFARPELRAQNLRVEVVPDLTRIRAADVRPLIDEIRALTERAHEDPALGTPDVATSLPDLLTPLPTALVVNQSGLLIPALQLLVLATTALSLTARSLLGHRRQIDALVRARGAGSVNLMATALVEATLLALPALAVAVPAATVLLPLLPHGGHAAGDTDLAHATGGGTATFGAAAAAVVFCALALAAPALRGGETYLAAQASRSARAVVLRRAGFDLAVLVLAVLAFEQLRRYTPVGATADGAPRLDPVVVAGPAVLLLAGAVVVVRLLPLAGRLAERAAARGRRLPAALASWEIGRGVRRHAGPLLLLVMAFAMAVFALCYSVAWRMSQADQAEFAVGADLRVVGSTLPPLGQAGLVAGTPGVAGSAAVQRTTTQLPELGSVTVLAVDSLRFGDVLRLRPDLAAPGAQAPQTIAALLAAGRPRDASATLPGRPAALDVTLRAAVQSGPALSGGTLTLAVEDASGQTGTLSADLPADGAEHTVHWDVSTLTGGGRLATPLRVVSVGYAVTVPTPTPADPGDPSAAPPAGPQGPAVVTVDVVRIRSLDSSAAPVGDLPAPALGDLRLRLVASTTEAKHWPTPPGVAGSATAPSGELLHFAFSTGAPSAEEGPADIRVTGLATLAGPAPSGLPAVVSDAFLARSGRSVGDEITVEYDSVPVAVHIVGSVRALPTTRADEAGLLVDASALQAVVAETATAEPPAQPLEWWIRAAPGGMPQAAAGLRATMSATTVLDRDSARAALLADPLQDGLRGALVIAACAATAIAAVGFALYSVTAVRERTGQTAILRALGTPRRQLGFVLTAEQAYVVGVGGLAGGGLGLLLAHTLVPRIALSRDGTAPPVPVIVHVPWPALAAGGVAVFAVFGLVSAAAVAMVQRSGVVGALRLGDER